LTGSEFIYHIRVLLHNIGTRCLIDWSKWEILDMKTDIVELCSALFWGSRKRDEVSTTYDGMNEDKEYRNKKKEYGMIATCKKQNTTKKLWLNLNYCVIIYSCLV